METPPSPERRRGRHGRGGSRRRWKTFCIFRGRPRPDYDRKCAGNGSGAGSILVRNSALSLTRTAPHAVIVSACSTGLLKAQRTMTVADDTRLSRISNYFAFGHLPAAGGHIFVNGCSSHGCGSALQI